MSSLFKYVCFCLFIVFSFSVNVIGVGLAGQLRIDERGELLGVIPNISIQYEQFNKLRMSHTSGINYELSISNSNYYSRKEFYLNGQLDGYYLGIGFFDKSYDNLSFNGISVGVGYCENGFISTKDFFYYFKASLDFSSDKEFIFKFGIKKVFEL